MISPKAVDEFLARTLEEHDWLKDVSRRDLLAHLTETLPNPYFKTEPFTHQLACFVLGIMRDRFLFFLDMGTGKTKIVLDLLNYRIGWGDAKRALVLVPNIVTIEGWLREVQTHSDSLNAVGLLGSRDERWATLESEGFADKQLAIINYAGIVSLACKPRKGKGTMEVDEAAVSKLRELFDVLVLDESQAVKNRSTITFQVLKHIAAACDIRYAMTGTPFGRDPQDLWAQFYLIDGGETLGRNITLFRSAYFDTVKNYWGGWEYKLDKRMEKDLHRALKNRSIQYRADECVDLPRVMFKTIRVEFEKDALSYYRSVLDEATAAKGNYREMENVFVRMRQLSSGFLSMREDLGEGEKGERVEIEFPTNPKLDALMGLVDELPADRKMVVFHEYIYSGSIISRALKEAKVKHERLYGGTRDKASVLQRFLDDPKVRVLVVNAASGGTGLNLQVANYCVFFESPVSPIVRQQAERRCHRTGQTRTTFIFDLVVRDSLDEQILAYIRQGKDLLKALIQGKEEWSHGRRTAKRTGRPPARGRRSR